MNSQGWTGEERVGSAISKVGATGMTRKIFETECFFLCLMPMLCGLFIYSLFITKLKIHHLYLLIIIHDNINIADPGSMQDM